MLGEGRSYLGATGGKKKENKTIAKRLSELCWAEVWLQPAAGEEVEQQGKGRTSVSFGLVVPCPEPFLMSGYAAWLICLSSVLGLPAVTRGDLGSVRAWGMRGQQGERGGDGGSRWHPTRRLPTLLEVITIGFPT